MAETYFPRVVDDELNTRLRAAGGVVIEGARACGKTATARQQSASEVLLDTDLNARRAVEIDPGLVLEGATPRLIDEWQIEPVVWNYVRRAIDDRGAPGQFILTGSAVPADDITRHTGAGRIGRLHMRPMSLYELGSSDGSISLRALLAGDPAAGSNRPLDTQMLFKSIVTGGWPAFRDLPEEDARQALRDYLDDVRRVDIDRISSVHHDPENVGRVLRSLARNIATEAPTTTLAADAGGPDGPLDHGTVRAYLRALARVFVTEDLPAWSTHLRSRHTLRKSPKRHFVDPSLAMAALGAGSEDLNKDFEMAGLLFESLAIRDLRVYSQQFGGRAFHYRDSAGLEVDAIIEAGDGRWGAFEIKLGSGRLDDAAANLIRFRDRVDTERRGEPAVLGVITGGGYGYARPDGVQTIPIASLGP